MNPNLRQVTVTVRYKVDNAWRNYRLVTYRLLVLLGRHDDDHATDSKSAAAASAGYSLIELLVSMGDPDAGHGRAR